MFKDMVLTKTDIKFILLSSNKNEDAIKFFSAVHEDYIKYIMNPFYELQSPIKSEALTTHIKQLLKQYKLE